MKKMFLIILISFSLTLIGQENKLNNENFIGKWEYIKTVDKENKPVKYIIRKLPNGKELKINASGPLITINRNGTYEKKFTEENTDSGNWKILSETEIEYELLTPIDSRGGKLIQQTHFFLKNRWKKDGKGNYSEKIKDIVLYFSNSEMKIKHQKDYILIYKKKKVE